MNSDIRFFTEEINFKFKNKGKTRRWLVNVLLVEEKVSPLSINYVFCSDKYLAELNLQYLQHNTYTDVLTFPNHSNPNKICGDIYLSVERIKENAEKYHQPFEIELARVMVHGLLHLLGYKDKTKQDKELMTLKEEFYLDKLSQF